MEANEVKNEEKTPEQIVAEAQAAREELDKTIGAAEQAAENLAKVAEPAKKTGFFQKKWVKRSGWGILAVAVVAVGAVLGMKYLDAEEEA